MHSALLCLLPASAAYVPTLGHARAYAPARRCVAPLLSADSPDDPDKSEYTVDWDSAWKSEMDTRETGTARWRPEGREPVSEEQIRTARVKQSLDDASFNLQVATRVRIHRGG